MSRTRNEQELPEEENQILIDMVNALCGRDKEILKKELGIDPPRLSRILNKTEKFKYSDLEIIFSSLKEKEKDVSKYIDDLSKLKESENLIKQIKSGMYYLTSKNNVINELSQIEDLKKQGLGYITNLNSEPFRGLADEYYCLFPKTSESDAKTNNCNYNIGTLTIDKEKNEVKFELKIPYEKENKRTKSYYGIISADEHKNIHITLFRHDEHNVSDRSHIQFNIFDNDFNFFIGLVLTTSFGEGPLHFPTAHRIALSDKPFNDVKKIDKILSLLKLSGGLYDRIDWNIQRNIWDEYKSE